MQSSKPILFAKSSPGEEQEKQRKIFWDKMSPTMESMIYAKDEDSTMTDTLEVLNYLPDYKGRRILDLNAGIGRFTALMAKDAAHVTVVDIVQKFIDVNREENQQYDNITFLCADATELDFPESSFDLVFSGWLYSNICNKNMQTVTERTLKWLAPGGHIFFRETFLIDSATTNAFNSHSFFRNQVEYCQLLQNVKYAEACFGNIRTKNCLFHRLVCKERDMSVQSYYMAKRVSKDDVGTLMDATDKLYTIPVLSKLERMFGESWITPGGEETAKKLICQVALGQGEYVLNLGCGTGGGAFLLVEHYGVDVHAVDLSSNMICTAINRLGSLYMNLKNKIQFEAADITEIKFQEASYDVIYSCNSIFRFKEKEQVFTKLYRLLKPGGKLLIADFCKGKCKDELQDLLDNFAINLISIKEYEKILKDSGFGDIVAKDDSENLSRVLQKDLKGFNNNKDAFVEEFSMNEFCDLVKWATNAVNWVDSKELVWGIFTARKC